MVSQGVFDSPEEASAAGVPGNILTRALGTSYRDPKLDTGLTAYEKGDIFLLCSDGLSDLVSDMEICQQIELGGHDLDMTANRLVSLACQAGGKDNISVILARAT